MRIVFLLILLSSSLQAERIFLKNGTVVDGTITQQSRTSIQVRTGDGRLLTLQKDAVRKIDYSVNPQKQEDDRRKKAQEQERQRLEAEKKAAEAAAAEEERLRREEKEAEKQKKPINDNLPQKPVAWWIEPVFAMGGGTYQSTLSTFYQDNYQATGYGDPLAGDPFLQKLSFHPDMPWDYQEKGIAQVSFRGGLNRFVFEMDVRSYQAKVNVLDITAAEGTSSSIQMASLVSMEKLQESHSSLRAGWQFLDAPLQKGTVFLGRRTLSIATDYSYAGAFTYTDFGSTVNGNAFSPNSSLSMEGSGTELSLEYERRLVQWPLVFRARLSLFQMNVNASLEELSFLGDASMIDVGFVSYANSYSHQGRALSLHGGYALSGGTELFVEWYGLRTKSFLEKVDHRMGFGVSASDPIAMTASVLLPPVLDREQNNSEVIQTLSFGVSHRFFFY